MGKFPLVSVIIPIYNVELYVKECILSVFEQDYPNIELLAVDDCGRDNSISIVKDLFRKHPKNITCQLLRHDLNRGLSAARNTGTKLSHGKYIMYLDSDDYLMPCAISRLVRKIEETDSDFVVFGFSTNTHGRGVGTLRKDVNLLSNNLECIHSLAGLWFTVTAWSKFVKKSFLLENNLWFKEGIVNEDAPWTFQLCLNARKIALLHEELYFYRYNPNSIMSDSKKKLVNDSNSIALQIFYDNILKRPDLWENKDIYIIFMRQVVIYFTMTAKQYGFGGYMKKIAMLKSLKYDGSWFKSKNIPVSYKLWNKAFDMPKIMAGVFTYLLLLIQRFKH